MSTKINHGRIKRRATLEQALAELVRIRPAFIQEARKAVATVIARKLAFGRDLAENYCFVDEDRNRWSRNRVLGQIEDAYRNQDNAIKTMNWDFIGSVSVLPFRGDVLMLTYWRNHAPFARLIEDAGFTDYHYQNSTDRPDTISEAEWDTRRDAWDEALPTGRAVDVAFEFQLVDWYDILSARYDTDLIRACAPSEKARKERVAYHLTEIEQFHGCDTTQGAMRIVRKVREIYPERVPSIHLCATPLQEV
ncbi:TPA: hypothetical protein L6A41_31475 [Pseudomonas aeruginosa]|uniref:hypothetical protein n=1 Tax=Pseudomonas aeruginosa TaxID=287 RepID=UPI000FF388D5|nr:hypothetical protein [Pseudomonas aeruginosa]RPS20662.1 hypothetical protein IPC1027_21700 [Pseudomonas aeruginosa]HBN9859122.1 hypothetical protein [Pseudomonas aeruginosa]HBP5968605.1 hypothetical protein [Pseudomonas aeruginosa]HBP5975873.1 hypothetical protein [Pseudomonas aeruginosa]HBP6034691.1 hypothetical protein [Pseudomonas aeruginosa]